MSTIDSMLHEIAEKACASPLPESEMIGKSLVNTHFTMEKITKSRIADALTGFAALTKLLIPPTAFHAFVQEHCVHETLPCIIRADSPTILVTSWIDTTGTPSAADRRELMQKFTKEETDHCLAFCKECPDLSLSLLYLGTMLEAYFTRLKEHAAGIDAQTSTRIAEFGKEWANAANLVRILTPALHMYLPRSMKPSDAFEAISQENINQAFNFLLEANAFEFKTPAFPSHNRGSLTFSCPAQAMLKEIIVEQGTLMLLIEKIRRIGRGESDDMDEITRYVRCREHVKKVAVELETLIRTSGKAGLIAVSRGMSTRLT